MADQEGNRIYRRSAQLLEAEVAGELIALEPNRGTCFGFNSVATEIWRKLERPRTFGELKHELLLDYDVSEDECARDLSALLEQMQQAELIEFVPEAAAKD